MPPRRSSVLEAPAAASRGAPAAAPRAPAVEVEGLERSYGDRVALEDVSFRLEAGHTLAVLGANGAGKSTLLRVLAGLLRPHAGRVVVLGADLPGEADAVRGRVGYVGHEPLLYRDLTGRENLRFHARLHGVGDARVEDLLAATDMERRADQRAAELSHGLPQRRADLDPAAAELLEPLIGRDAARMRVLVTHDVEAALGESDHVLGLRRGRPVLNEPSTGAGPRLARAVFA